MDSSGRAMWDLAEKLLSLEAADQTDEITDKALLVCEKIRLCMVKLAGTEGFRVLMLRALSMARLESPELQTVSVRSDGGLEGVEQVTPIGAIALVRNLLALLATFIGEPLTVRLVTQTWPELDKWNVDQSNE